MTDHTMKIKGILDTTEIERGVRRTTQLVESSFDKAGRPLFDEQTVKLLQTGIHIALSKTGSKMEQLVGIAKKLDDALSDGNKTEEERNDILDNRLKIEEKT